MTVEMWIQLYYGGVNAWFAEANNTSPQNVAQWIKKGYLIIGGQLYAPRRPIRNPLA